MYRYCSRGSNPLYLSYWLLYGVCCLGAPTMYGHMLKARRKQLAGGEKKQNKVA